MPSSFEKLRAQKIHKRVRFYLARGRRAGYIMMILVEDEIQDAPV